MKRASGFSRKVVKKGNPGGFPIAHARTRTNIRGAFVLFKCVKQIAPEKYRKAELGKT